MSTKAGHTHIHRSDRCSHDNILLSVRNSISFYHLHCQDSATCLHSSANPTLILWGADDAWIPLKNAYRFEEKIANSTVVVMKETGHLPMEEKPAESLAIALNFLSN